MYYLGGGIEEPSHLLRFKMCIYGSPILDLTHSHTPKVAIAQGHHITTQPSIHGYKKRKKKERKETRFQAYTLSMQQP